MYFIVFLSSSCWLSASWFTSPHTSFFFFNDTATTEIYTLSLHDALPISELALFSGFHILRWSTRSKRDIYFAKRKLLRAMRTNLHPQISSWKSHPCPHPKLQQCPSHQLLVISQSQSSPRKPVPHQPNQAKPQMNLDRLVPRKTILLQQYSISHRLTIWTLLHLIF